MTRPRLHLLTRPADPVLGPPPGAPPPRVLARGRDRAGVGAARQILTRKA